MVTVDCTQRVTNSHDFTVKHAERGFVIRERRHRSKEGMKDGSAALKTLSGYGLRNELICNSNERSTHPCH